MSMTDSATIWLSDAEITHSAGASLANTIYRVPLTITITGELGAGKTTFLQGFAQNLGIKEHITSPTYALEQRYETKRYGELLHLDLYRLSEDQAHEVVMTSEQHEGIRCIEWGNRMKDLTEQSDIHIHIEEDETDPKHARTLTITYRDVALPSSEQVQNWRDEVHLPVNVREHCDTVAKACEKLSELLLKRGTLLRPTTLVRTGELHDLLRFIDFDKGMQHPPHQSNEEDEQVWEQWLQKFPDNTHEEAVTTFLKDEGFLDLASIIEMHGLNLENAQEMTIEQKLLFYADKRVVFDQVVTVDERFSDFSKRYANGQITEFGKKWHQNTIQLEEELFPDGAPDSSELY